MRAHPSTRRLAVVLAGLTATPGPAFASPAVAPCPAVPAALALAQEPAGWTPSVQLPLGSRLELGTARILEPGDVADGPTLELIPAKADVGDPVLDRTAMRFASDARVQLWRPAGPRPAAPRVTRPAFTASALDLEPLAIGAEYVLLPLRDEGEPSDAEWSYLRVLDVSEKSVRVELCAAPAGADELVRDPIALTVDAEPTGHRLRWSSAMDVVRPRYELRRRVLGTDPASEIGGQGVPPAIAPEFDFGSWQTITLVEGDTYLDPEPPARRVVEYRLVRVDDQDRPIAGTLGATVRAVRVETPGEWPLDVGVGARIDLITGRLAAAGDPVHIEIGRSSPGSLAVKPLDGTRLALTAKDARDPENREWWIPPATDRRFIPGRTGILKDGGELEFVLPGGIAGRLHAENVGGDRWTLRRQIGLEGERLLPRPPEGAPSVYAAPGDPGAIVLTFPDFEPIDGVDATGVSIVVERELVFGRGDWTVVTESAPGARRVSLTDVFDRSLDDPLAGDAPVARLRSRQRIAFGPISHASEPIELLAAGTDEVARAAVLEDAVVALDDPAFQRRMEARAVLRALGEDARAALEAVATGDIGSRGVAARAVLESIEANDTSGRGATRRIRRRALEVARTTVGLEGRDAEELDAWLGEVPAALVTGGPENRAHGLLVFVDRAERGVLRAAGAPGDVREDCLRARIWAGAVAVADADAGVRRIADFVADLGPGASIASFEAPAPAYLLDPVGVDPSASESDALLPVGSWLELPGSAEELAWLLERRPELGDLDLGPPLAQLLHALRAESADGPEWPTSGDDRFFDYDARSAELVLRLVERARDGNDDRAMLDAASALFPGEDRVLAAWREVSDRRLASPSAGAVERPSILLDAADIDLLELTLEELAGDGDLTGGGAAAGIDVLLPSGVYEGGDAALVRTIDLRRSGIRLRAAVPGEHVEIRASLRVRAARNIAFEDIEIVSPAGSALSVMDGGHAIALRCRLAGSGSSVYVQDSDLELVECVVDGADLAKPPQWAVRELGASRLFARATLFGAGTLFLSDEARNWLDRCVVDAGQRTLVQAQRAGHLVARETLLRGSNLGLYNVETGILAAVVIDAARDPLGRRPSKLRISPRLFHLVVEDQRVPAGMKLANEPLRPR